jgi:hypothetical protein
MADPRPLRLVPLAVPYLTVPVGLYALHSGWAAILLYHAGMVLLITLLGAWAVARRLLRGWHLPALAGLLAVTAATGPVLYLLWPWIAGDGTRIGRDLAALGLGGASWIGFVTYYSLVNPWIEELYWRGVLGSDALHPVPADLCFAGYHVVVLLAFLPWWWAVTAALALTAAAWLWRQATAHAGGLLVPVLTHGVADVSIIVAAHLLARP